MTDAEPARAPAAADDAMLALDISATQLGFGFGWRDALSDLGYWSPQLLRMFGLPEQGPTPTREAFVALVEPAGRARVAGEITPRPAAFERSNTACPAARGARG